MILCISCKALAYENTIYIWQRDWGPDILSSLNAMHSRCQHFTVLGGEFQQKNGRVVFSKTIINWDYLKNKGAVTLALRLNTNLKLTASCDSLVLAVKSVMTDAQQHGIKITGIQIDYDSPTSKLKDFAIFMRDLKTKLPSTQLSITTLPTWINNVAFRDLIQSVDYYVLQLHSFELPDDADKSQFIFPEKKAPALFKTAPALKRPFYLSLPTYGYEIGYDKNRKYLGLRAEFGAQFVGEGVQKKLLFADPQVIAHFVQSLSHEKSPYFKGLSWFRLPIESDHFNWDIKTLQRVIVGEVPKSDLNINIVNAGKGVQEIYLINNGETNLNKEISFEIHWQAQEKPLYDVMSDFNSTGINNGMQITGRSPSVGKKVLVAWVRSDGDKLIHSKVKINEKE